MLDAFYVKVQFFTFRNKTYKLAKRSQKLILIRQRIQYVETN